MKASFVKIGAVKAVLYSWEEMSFYDVFPYFFYGLSTLNQLCIDDFREKRHLEDRTFLVKTN